MKNMKLAVIVVISLVLFLFVAQNTAPVEARFLWFRAEAPTILLLLLATAGGFILGMLVTLYTRRDSWNRDV